MTNTYKATGNKAIVVFAVLLGAVSLAGCSKSAGTRQSGGRASQIKAGDKAPDFTLKDQDGHDVSLTDLTANSAVLVAFYPQDDSPVCTVEMKEFRDMYDEYNKLGVQIVGISTNSLESHMKFKRKHELPFPLLSDEGTDVSRAYGVLHEKKGVSQRSYFLVGGDGVIRYMFVEQHQKEKRDADELLASVKKALAGKE